jgi:hypothetical protein
LIFIWPSIIVVVFIISDKLCFRHCWFCYKRNDIASGRACWYEKRLYYIHIVNYVFIIEESTLAPQLVKSWHSVFAQFTIVWTLLSDKFTTEIPFDIIFFLLNNFGNIQGWSNFWIWSFLVNGSIQHFWKVYLILNIT